MAEEQSLKSGTCPKCGGKEVYADKDKERHNDRAFIAASPMTVFTLDTYLCISCGHFEEYLKDSEIQNEKIKARIREKWTKI